MTQCRMQCALLTSLILVATLPPAAWGIRSVAGSMVGPNGQPLALSPIVVMNDAGRVIATGKTDDKGRYCIEGIEGETLPVGKPYRVCAAKANLPMQPCATVAVTETRCTTAFGLLGAGGVLSGLTTAELVGVGVGAAGATGLGVGLGIAETGGGGRKEQPGSRSR